MSWVSQLRKHLGWRNTKTETNRWHLSEKLHQARKEERDAAQQCLKVIRVRTLLKHEPHDRKSHYFTITAASGSLYLLASIFFIKNSNEQANRNFRKYSYFRLSKHNKTDHPFKSQKNSYKKKGERFKIRDRGAIPLVSDK